MMLLNSLLSPTAVERDAHAWSSEMPSTVYPSHCASPTSTWASCPTLLSASSAAPSPLSHTSDTDTPVSDNPSDLISLHSNTTSTSSPSPPVSCSSQKSKHGLLYSTKSYATRAAKHASAARLDSKLTLGPTGREQQRPDPNAYSDNANEYEVQRVAYAAGVPREMLSVFRADPFETKLCVFGPDAVFEPADDQSTGDEVVPLRRKRVRSSPRASTQAQRKRRAVQVYQQQLLSSAFLSTQPMVHFQHELKLDLNDVPGLFPFASENKACPARAEQKDKQCEDDNVGRRNRRSHGNRRAPPPLFTPVHQFLRHTPKSQDNHAVQATGHSQEGTVPPTDVDHQYNSTQNSVTHSEDHVFSAHTLYAPPFNLSELPYLPPSRFGSPLSAWTQTAPSSPSSIARLQNNSFSSISSMDSAPCPTPLGVSYNPSVVENVAQPFYAPMFASELGQDYLCSGLHARSFGGLVDNFAAPYLLHQGGDSAPTYEPAIYAPTPRPALTSFIAHYTAMQVPDIDAPHVPGFSNLPLSTGLVEISGPSGHSPSACTRPREQVSIPKLEPQSPGPIGFPSGEPLYPCSLCPRKFSRAQGLALHIKSHGQHGETGERIEEMEESVDSANQLRRTEMRDVERRMPSFGLEDVSAWTMNAGRSAEVEERLQGDWRARSQGGSDRKPLVPMSNRRTGLEQDPHATRQVDGLRFELGVESHEGGSGLNYARFEGAADRRIEERPVGYAGPLSHSLYHDPAHHGYHALNGHSAGNGYYGQSAQAAQNIPGHIEGFFDPQSQASALFPTAEPAMDCGNGEPTALPGCSLFLAPLDALGGLETLPFVQSPGWMQMMSM